MDSALTSPRNQAQRTCGQKCSHEMRELFCKPRARCFKGLAILSFIYAVGCALMLLFIPPVINAHGWNSLTDAGKQVEENLHSMVLSTIIMLVVFVGLMVLNGLLWMYYGKKEGRRESIINGDLMADGFENAGGSND